MIRIRKKITKPVYYPEELNFIQAWKRIYQCSSLVGALLRK